MRHIVLLAALAAAPASAQGSDSLRAPAPEPAYVAYRCEGGGVLVRVDGDPAGPQEIWLDDEDVVRTLPSSEVAGVFTDGTYSMRRAPELSVERDGAAVRTHCLEGSGEPTARLEGRPGIRIAWARRDPTPLTTYLQSPDDDPSVWVGADLLVLDGTTMDSVSVRPDEPANYTLVEVRLTPEAAGTLAAITTEHVGQPLAFLSDGVLLLAPTIQEPIRGGTFMLSMTDRDADRIAALFPTSP